MRSCITIIAAIITVMGATCTTGHYQPQRAEAEKGQGVSGQSTGSITGTLRTAADGVPMPDTEVILFDHLGLASQQRIKTDIEGRYAFRGLVPSVYTVQALKRNFTGNSGSEGERTLKLVEGQRVDKVDLRLRPGGSIEGHVLDENGSPISNVMVTTAQVIWSNEIAETFWGRTPSMTRTDNHGFYQLGGLETGKYYVCTMLKFGIKSQPLGHTATYAPGTTRLEDARSLWVAAGMKVSRVNISLKGVRWFRVSGVVLDSQGQPAVFPRGGLRANPPPGKIVLVDDVDKGPNSTFEAKLPTGDHELAVTTMAGEFGHVRVSVKDRDVSGVTIRTSPGATIAGRMEIHGTSAPEPLSIIVGTIAADAAGHVAPAGGSMSVRSDGTFMLSKLFGSRRFFVYIPIVGWALDSVWMDGRNITDTAVTFNNTPHDVRIALTSRTTHTRCVVLDKQGHHALAEVLIYAPDPDRWYPESRFESRSMFVDDGPLQFDGLAPGDYLAVAIPIRNEIYGAEDIEIHEYLRQFAMPFTLHAGEKKTSRCSYSYLLQDY
jgi:hypothetical protein